MSEGTDAYSLAELEARPTLCVGQADDLKIEVKGRLRVWLSRCSTADGEPCNNKVTEEVWSEGQWRTLREYEAT
jgi:hypothetical protein